MKTNVNGEYKLCFAQDATAIRASAPFSHKLTVKPPKPTDILHIADANHRYEGNQSTLLFAQDAIALEAKARFTASQNTISSSTAPNLVDMSVRTVQGCEPVANKQKGQTLYLRLSEGVGRRTRST